MLLRGALACLVVAALAAAVGFGAIAGTAGGVAKFLFGLFVAVFVILVLLGLFAERKVP